MSKGAQTLDKELYAVRCNQTSLTRVVDISFLAKLKLLTPPPPKHILAQSCYCVGFSTWLGNLLHEVPPERKYVALSQNYEIYRIAPQLHQPCWESRE